ncbi:hypothetical protein BKA93DRAFT_779740 [Sparassis latifolia]
MHTFKHHLCSSSNDGSSGWRLDLGLLRDSRCRLSGGFRSSLSRRVLQGGDGFWLLNLGGSLLNLGRYVGLNPRLWLEEVANTGGESSSNLRGFRLLFLLLLLLFLLGCLGLRGSGLSRSGLCSRLFSRSSFSWGSLTRTSYDNTKRATVTSSLRLLHRLSRGLLSLGRIGSLIRLGRFFCSRSGRNLLLLDRGLLLYLLLNLGFVMLEGSKDLRQEARALGALLLLRLWSGLSGLSLLTHRLLSSRFSSGSLCGRCLSGRRGLFDLRVFLRGLSSGRWLGDGLSGRRFGRGNLSGLNLFNGGGGSSVRHYE